MVRITVKVIFDFLESMLYHTFGQNDIYIDKSKKRNF